MCSNHRFGLVDILLMDSTELKLNKYVFSVYLLACAIAQFNRVESPQQYKMIPVFYPQLMEQGFLRTSLRSSYGYKAIYLLLCVNLRGTEVIDFAKLLC